MDENLRTALGAAPGLVWLSDTSGRLVYFNDAWAAATGMKADKSKPDAAWMLVHPDDRDRLGSAYSAFSGRPTSYEYRLRQADGNYRWVVERVQPWLDATGATVGYIGSALDIQDQKEHEHRLALITLRQTSLTCFSRVALEQSSPDEINREALRLFCEHLGVDAALLLLREQEEDALSLACARGLSGEAPAPVLTKHEGTGATVDYPEEADAFPVDSNWMQAQGWRDAVALPVDPQHPRLGWLVGLRSGPGRGSIGPLHYARDLASILAIAHARYRAQIKLREGEERAQQVQKMEAVGLLAGGVAHDFNNLLTAIRCFAELLRDDLPDAEQRSRVDDILHASSRASHLVRQLLAFSRQDVTQSESLDLNTLVDDLRGFIRSLLSEHVRIEVELAESPAWCRADSKQLEQVLFNLCLNARDVMITDGVLTLRVSTGLIAPDGTRRVRLSVSDTGPGIPPEVRTRLFQPFYSTKARGRGTGLGLATSLNIVRAFGGDLTYETELGRGTTFHMDLPEVDDPLTTYDKTLSDAAEQRPAHLLLVEDDDLVRSVTRMLAESLGHRVTTFGDSQEAAAWAAETGLRDIDVLVTDIVMPGMNGYALSKRLREIKSDLRVFYMSGYVDDAT
ncbi:MAG: hypothetical protein RL376_892, partial [Verrucomicrobiota bacterium]